MNIITGGLVFVVVLLILAFSLHRRNLERRYRIISSLCEIQESKDFLYRGMIASQGLNFNFLIATSWILFFMSTGYLYFLMTSFSIYYSLFPTIASSTYGFSIFGIAFILEIVFFIVMLIIQFQTIYIYGYYEISKPYKMILVGTIPLLLFSLTCSGYAGTIFPDNLPAIIEMGAFLSLIISEVILLSPILREALEAEG